MPSGAMLVGYNGGLPTPAIAFVGSNSSTTDSASYDFGTFNAATAGILVVGTGGRSSFSSAINGISIGGVPATFDTTPASSSVAALGYRAVAAGSHNVTVTASVGLLRCACVVWLVTNYFGAIPYDTILEGPTGTSVSGNINLPSKGVSAYVNVVANANAVTWTNATEDADFALEAADRVSGASLTNSSAQTGYTVTAAGSGSNLRILIGASWR